MPTLKLLLTGAVLVPLKKGSQGDSAHENTHALLMGGRHRPVLGIRYDRITRIEPERWTRPARVFVTPENELMLLIDVLGQDVSIRGGASGLHLGTWSPGRSGANQKHGDSDLGDLVNLSELDATVELKNNGLSVVGARLVLDRGTVSAIPLGGRSWEYLFSLPAGGQDVTRSVSDGCVLEITDAEDICIKSSDGSQSIVKLEPGDPIHVSLASFCDFAEKLDGVLDLSEFPDTVLNKTIGDRPAVKTREGLQSAGQPKCSPAIVRY